MRGEAERYMRAATHGRDAPRGGYRYELETGRWTLSDNARRILGLSPDEPVNAEVLASFRHPDDVSALDTVMESILDGRSYHHFYRVVTRGGRTLSVLGVGQLVDGDETHGRAMVGYLIDLTPAARRSELDQAFAAVTAGFDETDPARLRAQVVEQARGLLMGVMGVDEDRATDLLRDCAERIQAGEATVAGHVVSHFQNATGIRRSMTQLRHEVADVLGQD